MNGTANRDAPRPFGSEALANVRGALEAVYNPQSSNGTRQEATAFLEEAKRNSQAPTLGHTLAADKAQPPAIRHFGLSMLEYPIKYRYEDLEEQQQAAILRQWVVGLAKAIDDSDPAFIRNKIAHIWAEFAKKSWMTDWFDMDMLLVEMWQGSMAHKGVVLYVLEMLSEDIFNREDSSAGLRGPDLAKACVEIFTPLSVLNEHYKSSRPAELVEARCGEEGWISRLCDLLASCLQSDPQNDARAHSCAIKVLNSLKAAINWIMPKALHATHCLDHLCEALAVPDVQIQMATTEVLFAFYNRAQGPFIQEPEYTQMFTSMLTPSRVCLLRDVYHYSQVRINDLDEPRYAVCKKFAEVLSMIGEFIEHRPSAVPAGTDLTIFFDLLTEALRNPSLVVSIPVLHAWTRLLRSKFVNETEAVTRLIGVLLEICSSRLLRYEYLPDDSDEVTLAFLSEDFDTIPERHAFLGNYRRYCVDVVERIVRLRPFEAMYHILGQGETLFQNLYDGQPPFHPRTYAKNSLAYLRAEAQSTIVESALKGYLRRLTEQDAIDKEHESQSKSLEVYFEKWCHDVLTISIGDPDVKKKLIQLATTFATKALYFNSGFAMWLVEFLLSLPSIDQTDYPKYSEAVKGLDNEIMSSLQRLAILFPNDLLAVYDQLEARVQDLLDNPNSDERRRAGCQAFLFIVIQRTTALDEHVRYPRLQAMLQPVKNAWQTPDILSAVSSYEAFCQFLGLGDLIDFLQQQQFDKTQDWASRNLDEAGKAKQADIQTRCCRLPLRITKTMLGASTEKLREDSPAYKTATSLWAEVIPVLLPKILQLTGFAQAFTDLNNWSHLPFEHQQLVRKMLTDRFWQAGISNESKDEFYARISGSKISYEGFGSTVRGAVRQIRETCYFILYGMTRLREQFYGIPDLGEPLAQALFANANGLSAHQLSVLLSISTSLIESCPSQLRQQFLPPVIITLFTQFDRRISADWEELERQKLEIAESGTLVEEMKSESILRQLTHSTITLIATLLDQQMVESTYTQDPLQQTMRNFILSNPNLLEPIVLFLTHAIRMRDSRCCTILTRVLRSIIPAFQETPANVTSAQVPAAAAADGILHYPSNLHILHTNISSPACREFISLEVLKACITSIHEPYFVDLQRDLGSLISSIIYLYAPSTPTPRAVLLSLPGMTPEQVDRAFKKIMNSSGNEKMQRAVVLDLLEGVRGTSIHETGKIERSAPRKPKVQERFMEVDAAAGEVEGKLKRDSPELVGVADMFEGG
ncbi:MAG: hypothetical protein M1820_005759 [Bogoriella megaspora]|nr:MAG: hypothetical protein M1820_005759 [Bogoriella megaspora]